MCFRDKFTTQSVSPQDIVHDLTANASIQSNGILITSFAVPNTSVGLGRTDADLPSHVLATPGRELVAELATGKILRSRR